MDNLSTIQGRQHLNLFLSAHKWAQCRFKAQAAILHSGEHPASNGKLQCAVTKKKGVDGSVCALIQLKHTVQQQ